MRQRVVSLWLELKDSRLDGVLAIVSCARGLRWRDSHKRASESEPLQAARRYSGYLRHQILHRLGVIQDCGRLPRCCCRRDPGRMRRNRLDDTAYEDPVRRCRARPRL
jgi:hypothetical protein